MAAKIVVEYALRFDYLTSTTLPFDNLTLSTQSLATNLYIAGFDLGQRASLICEGELTYNCT